MLSAAGFSQALQHALWAQTAKTATHLEHIIVDETVKTSSEKLLGFNPAWTQNLHTFW
jgi:hypothetical protein